MISMVRYEEDHSEESALIEAYEWLANQIELLIDGLHCHAETLQRI